jgi:enediyne biosynthesis protein E4
MDLFSGASYASQSQQILHFGLGSLTTVDRLEVNWPNGQKEAFPITAINNLVTLKQGTGSKQ